MEAKTVELTFDEPMEVDEFEPSVKNSIEKVWVEENSKNLQFFVIEGVESCNRINNDGDADDESDSSDCEEVAEIQEGTTPDCLHCNLSFPSILELRKHMFQHSTEGRTRCKYCDKIIKPGKAARHERIHLFGEFFDRMKTAAPKPSPVKRKVSLKRELFNFATEPVKTE